jgi:hypothetical protein
MVRVERAVLFVMGSSWLSESSMLTIYRRGEFNVEPRPACELA